MQSEFGLSLACRYKQRHATSNQCRAKQHNSSSERQREQQNYQRDNPIAQTWQNGATASGQDTENFSETSSAEQRREERMKKLDIKFEKKDANGTGTVRAEEDRAGNANEGTGNQASTIGRRA